MNVNTILSVFTPKDIKFFPLLKESASIAVAASGLLIDLLSLTEHDRRKSFCQLIKAEEIKGDKVTNQILKALNATFITPFDREDINALADEMDDVTDCINRTAQKILLYDPKTFPESSLALAEIIQKGTLEILGATQELAHLKKTDQGFRKHYKEIKRLEEEADGLYEKGIVSLFQQETNAVELIKSKEIIQELEKTANKINNTGKVFKTIFIKYS